MSVHNANTESAKSVSYIVLTPYFFNVVIKRTFLAAVFIS